MIEKLLRSIRGTILNHGLIKTCLLYSKGREEVIAPAIFLEIGSYSAGSDPATGELSLTVNIEARVVIDSLTEDAEIKCQELAAAIASAIHLNSFGCEVSPAKVTSISRDYFKPDFDPYVCYLIEWNHELHIGENIWSESGIPPHKITIGGPE
ncbi:MAG: hypothetical protein IJ730_04125 [Alphaproteobacteria bacterium]|nr:hypothetical protein [Alphaproteobacteria bacterium]